MKTAEERAREYLRDVHGIHPANEQEIAPLAKVLRDYALAQRALCSDVPWKHLTVAEHGAVTIRTLNNAIFNTPFPGEGQ